MSADKPVQEHHSTHDYSIDARAFHESILVIDETAPLLGSNPNTYRLWASGGATAVAPTVALNDGPGEALAKIARWLRFVDRHERELLLVREPGDLQRAHDGRRLGILLHFQNSVPLGTNLDLATAYHDLGVRMIQLAYNQKNFVGDGCEERTDGGLSRFGLELVAELNRLGVIVDLSHTGHRTTLEAAEASHAPVMFSHANARAVHPSPRNIDDDQIAAVAATGGLIGAVGFPAFVSDSPRPTVQALIRHIDHVVDVAGIDHVGIGLDYFDKMDGIASEDAARAWYDETVATGRWSAAAYPPPPWRYPAEIADPSRLPALTEALLAHGYPRADVAKIMGGNFARVFTEVRSSRGRSSGT